MRTKKIIILICIFFIQLGCDIGGLEELPPNFDPKNLVGEYMANHKLGKDQLFVHSDGTYDFKYRSLGDKVFAEKGTWVFHGGKITLNNYVPFWERYVHGPITKEPFSWETYIQVKDKKVMILMNLDMGYYYIKV